MARRIRARTLTHLLDSYVRQFPDDAALAATGSSAVEGAELLTLVAGGSAWVLLDRLHPSVSVEWLRHGGDPVLRRLFERSAPEPLSRLWPTLDTSLQTRVMNLVDAPTATRLKSLANTGGG